jgi:hypothetical protein
VIEKNSFQMVEMSYIDNNFFVVLVSSQNRMLISFKSLKALKVISSLFQIGVGTKYNITE